MPRTLMSRMSAKVIFCGRLVIAHASVSVLKQNPGTEMGKLVLTMALFLFGATAICIAQQEEAPIWREARPGASAFLKDSAICDTERHFLDWQFSRSQVGCHPSQAGTRATIEAIFDEPLFYYVRINISSQKLVAYTLLTNLQPAIPPGTILRGVASDPKDEISGCGKLFPKAKVPEIGTPAAKENQDLSDAFLAKVIEHDRSHKGEFPLHITVTGGEFDGQTGWADDGCFNDTQGADVLLFEVPR